MTRYLVTDPCYVVDNKDWDKFLTATDTGDSLPADGYVIEGVGKVISMEGSNGGDGSWHPEVLRPSIEVNADAGLVCIVELLDSYTPTAYNGNAITEDKGTAEDWLEYVATRYDSDEEDEDRSY